MKGGTLELDQSFKFKFSILIWFSILFDHVVYLVWKSLPWPIVSFCRDKAQSNWLEERIEFTC
jgi:hypothetical protein